MPQLLLELGAEELPAFSVKRAFTELSAGLSAALVKESILDGGDHAVAMGTPRRLIVAIDRVAERQPNSQRDTRGPGIKGAYDGEGKATPALLGFCRGQGVGLADVWQDGQYVWVTKQIQGRSTGDILSEVLPASIRSLTF